MKIIVVGTGSIGLRHAKNLTDMGHEVYAVDVNPEHLSMASSCAKKMFGSLDDALALKPEAAFICTFSNCHISPALKCADAGCHLFIEKPLSLKIDRDVNKLIGIAEKKNLISMVGCNMRFHPAISYIHDALESDPRFSKKLWADIECGYYLPFAKKDHKSSYMANKDKGGNIIFDAIHELDYAAWFFGKPREIFCSQARLSDVTVDVSDAADILIRFDSGAACSLHMDYLQHGYGRRCKVVCKDASIVWDFAFGKIGIVSAENSRWEWKDFELPIYLNQMYVDEAKYFLECVSDNKQTFNSIKESLVALKLAILADKGYYAKRWEKFR